MLVSPSAIYYITILREPLSNNTRECCNCSRMSEFAGNFTKRCFTFYYCGGRAKKIMLEGHLGGGTVQDIEHMEIMLNFAYKVLGESTAAPHIDN